MMTGAIIDDLQALIEVARASIAALGTGDMPAGALRADVASMRAILRRTARRGGMMAGCVNCGEPIRRAEPSDRIDPRDYEWVHEGGNPICDLTMVASPGGDGHGPAPITGYLIDGKLWHPSDVTIVRDAPQVTDG